MPPLTEREQEQLDRVKTNYLHLSTRPMLEETVKMVVVGSLARFSRILSSALLKERFPYPIFLYNADKVGITATGEADQNELYPKDNQPPDIETTCLELHQEFRIDAEEFLLSLEESIA